MHSFCSILGKKLPGWAAILLICVAFTACSEKEAEPLGFSILATQVHDCIDGMAKVEFDVSNGHPPYSYYIIPEEQWYAGDMMHEMLVNNDFSRLYRYAFYHNGIEVKGGSAENPRSYWVCVQDRTGDAPLSGANMMSWWKKINVVCAGMGAD